MTAPAQVRLVALDTNDQLVIERLAPLADEFALTLSDPGAASPGEIPFLVVVDLERPDAVERVTRWRERHPEALLAAHLVSPRRDVWVAAERAGCDLVANRGAFARQLRTLLATWREGGARRRFPLFDVADAAGRLGLVYRTAETPVGPVAVYRTEGAFHAVRDACPHAGAALSEGAMEGPIVTCPRHGSQFDVRSGERVRGPADRAVEVFPLLEEAGRVYLLTAP